MWMDGKLIGYHKTSNAEATFVQCTKKQKPSKSSHVGIHWIALTTLRTDEYPCGWMES